MARPPVIISDAIAKALANNLTAAQGQNAARVIQDNVKKLNSKWRDTSPPNDSPALTKSLTTAYIAENYWRTEGENSTP